MHSRLGQNLYILLKNWSQNSMVFKSINHKMYVGEIFCYLAKAFDCVNHEILLAKLHFYGIRGVSEGWFGSYLTNRRQTIEVKSPN
jgi:hypothetical protein